MNRREFFGLAAGAAATLSIRTPFSAIVGTVANFPLATALGAAAVTLPTLSRNAMAQNPQNFTDVGALQRWEIDNAGKTLPQNWVHPSMASSTVDDVNLRLICVVDASSSVDYEEWRVQLEVMADALASNDFHDAIFSPAGVGSVALCVVDFGSGAELRIPWMDIRKGEEYKLPLLAEEVRNLLRRESGSTYHTRALVKSMECFDHCVWQGDRNVVDIITDGKTTGGGAAPLVHKMAVDYRATVNALITLVPTMPDLEEWAKKKLVTQDIYNTEEFMLDPGFVKVVATQQSTKNPGAIVKYKDAMKVAFRRKLILETTRYDLDDFRKINYAMKQNTNRRTLLFPHLRT